MEFAAIEDDRKHKFLMTARFEWVFHLRTFHITTDECGDLFRSYIYYKVQGYLHFFLFVLDSFHIALITHKKFFLNYVFLG